jgi:RNA polymerase sigma-70 factor (ECF subfamily)
MDRQARIRWMVDTNTQFVTRMLQRAGVPRADLDDHVQRTFIVAARRVDDVELGAERKFLARVAFNVAAHARRDVARRREVFNDEPLELIDALATPEQVADRKQLRRLLDSIVGTMRDSLRVVFSLHEFDEMRSKEIAALLGIPRGTVASRLRRAREYFRRHVLAIELAWDSEAANTTQADERALVRRGKVSPLERGLLGAGKSIPPSHSALAKTLAVLGMRQG